MTLRWAILGDLHCTSAGTCVASAPLPSFTGSDWQCDSLSGNLCCPPVVKLPSSRARFHRKVTGMVFWPRLFALMPCFSLLLLLLPPPDDG